MVERDEDGGVPTLERELGLRDIVMFGVGGIVGAGVYAIIGVAAGYGGNLLWVSFLVAAVVAFLTAASYAELASRYPDAGGSFEYVKRAFGLRPAVVASLAMLLTAIAACGAIAISFGEYLSRLLDTPLIVTTVGILLAMGLVNALGAAEASWFNSIATVITMAGLAAVVVVSWGDIGTVDLLDAGDTDLLALGVGAALVFFSFIGFEDLVKLSEETRDPSRTMPLGLLISAGIVLVVYLAVAVAAVSALGPDHLAESPGPLAEIMESKAGRGWATALVVVALFATSKTILSNLLGSSRLVYDVARDSGSRRLSFLSRVNAWTRTPVRAIALVTVAAIGFGAIGDLTVVAATSNVLIMTVFIVVNASLIRIRMISSDVPRFRVPGSIGSAPITALLAIAGVTILLVLNLMSLLRVV